MTKKKQILHASIWVGVERFSQQGIQFFVSILLARLLTPSEFGLVAMISIFMAFSTHLINGGFQSALIQKKNATHIDESTAFWFNLLISAVMTFSLFFAAPWIARFFNQPRLIAITQWSSFNLLLTGFSVVQFALLQKEFLIKKRAIVTVLSVAVGGIISIIMAFKGYGVWALVALGLGVNFSRVIFVWILHAWRPAFIFSWDSFKSLFGFGSRLLGASLMTAIYENIYQLIIGKMYTASDLGFFQRAKRFMMLCSYTPIAMITQIHFPYLCKLQDDREAVKKTFSKSLKYSVMATLPVLVGLGVAAPNFIIFLVGSKWLPSVPYLQIMCATGIIYVAYMMNLDVIKALGYSGQLLKVELFKRILLGISIVLLYRFGIIALLYGEVVCSFIAMIIVARMLYRHIKVGILIQFRWLASCFISATLMGVIVYFSNVSFLSHGQALFLQITLGGLVYFGLLFILRDQELLFVVKKGSELLMRKLNRNG